MEEFLKEQAAFVSHAVHELRTPMTSIRGYSDMLRSMGALNDMQKQFVETIRVNSRRMEGLLTDVSDTSKIKGGDAAHQPQDGYVQEHRHDGREAGAARSPKNSDAS